MHYLKHANAATDRFKEWRHSHFHSTNGTRREEEGTQSAGTVYGILQPNSQLRGGESAQGLQRSRSQWLHSC